MTCARIIGFFLVFVFLTPIASSASELFAPSPIEEVSVRTLPGFTVLETDDTGALETSWEHGFRLGARFAARAGSGLNTPTIITLGEWEKSPVATGSKVHVLVQCLLDPLPNFPSVRDPGAMVRDMPGMTVACYAQRGNYSPESFMTGLHKIEDYLKARHLAETGPPRYLFYTTTSWMPSWWRIGEVQIPIGSRPGG